jgi:hypothetical protein
MRLRIMVTLALVSLSLPLCAQDAALPPGTRLRVGAPCGQGYTRADCGMVVGRLVAHTGNDLVLEDAAGMRHRVTLSPGVRLQRSAGYRRHTLLGLGLGSLAGLATGAALNANCTRGGRGEDNGLCHLYYVVAVPAGAGVGAVMGALSRTERWETRSPPDAVLRIELAAGRTRVAVMVTF